MYLLNIANVQPGQVIAKAVTTPTGAVLCPAGFRLTETAIDRLRNAGIDAIVVEGTEESGPTLQERLAELSARFEGIDDPIMLQLKATIEKRLNFLYLGRGQAV